jgi:hypothetical protein
MSPPIGLLLISCRASIFATVQQQNVCTIHYCTRYSRQGHHIDSGTTHARSGFKLPGFHSHNNLLVHYVVSEQNTKVKTPSFKWWVPLCLLPHQFQLLSPYLWHRKKYVYSHCSSSNLVRPSYINWKSCDLVNCACTCSPYGLFF